MQKTSRALKTSLILAILFTQFNNCSPYTAQEADNSSFSVVSCTTPNCITTDINNLSATAHTYGGEVPINASQPEFNVGGDCNEGGFAYNKVRWELMLNGRVVRHSSMMVAGNNKADGHCTNGRFLLYVNLASIAEDPVNRTGLMYGQGSARSAYSLNIILYGMTTSSDPGTQTTKSKTIVPLSAI